MNTTKVTVRVPATTANLGPGFDCMGMALDLFNTFTFGIVEESRIEINGEGAGSLSTQLDNLVFKAASVVYKETGETVPKLHILCDNQIPVSRGLGSSAAAVIGGLLGANSLIGDMLSNERLLQIASEIEGHSDNVVPAMRGGCQIVLRDEDQIITSHVSVADGLKVVLFVPNVEMSTSDAREVLPQHYERPDVVFNMGRVAMLVNALSTGDFTNLRTATQDRLHQPYRLSLFPQMSRILDAAILAGALGSFLSGAGSSVVALASDGEKLIGEAMWKSAMEAGISGTTMICSLWLPGAEVLLGG